MKMAEVAALKVVADLLISLAKTELGVAWGVKTEITMLSSAVTTIRGVVADAELKQINNKAVEEWLIKLKHAAYDAKGVFDDLAIDEPRLLRPDHRTGEGCFNWVCDSLRSFFINVKRLIPHYKIAKKIKKIRKRFDRIVKEMSDFHLITKVVDVKGQATTVPPPSISEDRVTSSASLEPQMYGRNADKENIIRMLLENVNSKNEISVCPILGIGGLGKTTLAQFVFDDDRVKKHFNVRIWLCVSNDFNVKRLLKEIVRMVTKLRYDHDNLDVIREHVKEQLTGKRFLLVLDDVWSDVVQDNWYMLKKSLTTGALIGSSIIVTTRLEQVASLTKTISEPYQLSGLSEDDCWSLFKSYAFKAGKELYHLKIIGEEIVRKCGGLPLAVKVLGNMLCGKVEDRQWEEVRDNEIWDLEKKEENKGPKILPALVLSYHNLTSRAKQCFAYCSFFPKDYEMSKKELIYLWLANGLLVDENKELEDVGEDAFKELQSHSFFQDIEEDVGENTITFKIHDLLHDLASSVMEREHKHHKVEVWEVRNKLNNDAIQDPEIRLRHLSITLLPSSQSQPHFRDDSSHHPFDSSQQLPLHTLLLFPKRGEKLELSAQDISAISNLKDLRVLRIGGWDLKIELLPLSFGKNLKHLMYLNLNDCGLSSLQAESFHGMKSLRILDLTGNHNLRTVPNSLGKHLEHLKHLNLKFCGLLSLPAGFFSCMKNIQFLDLSYNGLETIPDSISNLESLIHLNLGFNGALETLPGSIGNLKKLETLNLNDCYRLKALPPRINELRSLRHLENSGCFGLKGMPSGVGQHLSQLKNLRLWVADNIEELRGLNLLRGSLTIEIKDRLGSSEDEEVLTNKNDLSELWIIFKREVEDANSDEQVLRVLKPPSNIELLEIRDYSGRRFPEWMEMRDPSSSFPALEHLTIEGCKSIKAFPKELWNLSALKTLKIARWHKLVTLPIGLQKLTSLEALSIYGCSELVSLPQLQLMTSLKELVIQKCPKLEFKFEGLGHLTSLQELCIRECPGVVIPKAELEALVALRGPSLLRDIDEEVIIQEYAHSTISGTSRGKQVLQVPIHEEDYSQSEITRIHDDADNNDNSDISD